LLKWRDFHEHASAGVRPSWRVEDVVLLCRFPHDRPFEHVAEVGGRIIGFAIAAQCKCE